MGVGGAGLSAVTALMKHSLLEVAHMCMDTDAQALKCHEADLKVLIGQRATHGLCGARPDYGRRAVDGVSTATRQRDEPWAPSGTEYARRRVVAYRAI